MPPMADMPALQGCLGFGTEVAVSQSGDGSLEVAMKARFFDFAARWGSPLRSE